MAQGHKCMQNENRLPEPFVGWLDRQAAAHGGMVLLLLALVLLRWTWLTWPDVIVDFGKELYVAWQIASGKALYADLAHYSGPLSSYVNGLIFALFGPGLLTLAMFNLILWVVLAALLYQLMSEIARPFAVMMALAVFILLFSFGQFVRFGNYNFICPYAHELTHGFLLSATALFFFSRHLRTLERRDAVGCGLALGLALLTKIEVFLPGACAVAAGFALQSITRQAGPRRVLASLGLVFSAALAIVVVALLLLAWRAGWPAAAEGILTPWRAGIEGRLLQLPFFKRAMGLDHPLDNCASLALWAGGYALFFGWPVVCGFLPGRTLRVAGASAVAAFLALGLVLARTRVNWVTFARPLPLAVCLAALPALVRLARGVGGRAEVLRGAIGVFAALQLLKMILNAHIYHYGFVLAAPAAMLAVLALTDWLPTWMERRGGWSWGLRGLAVAAIAVTLQVYLSRMGQLLREKNVVVGTGVDAFRADLGGVFIHQFLDQARRHLPAKATLAALPEGAMLNYLLRRENPTPYTNLMPPEVLVFGEARILAAYRQRPPDFIALVHKDTSEFGPRFFGQDYARDLARWIGANYEPVFQVGETPFQGERFGILLLRQKL